LFDAASSVNYLPANAKHASGSLVIGLNWLTGLV
jgi:hypothetical protein